MPLAALCALCLHRRMSRHPATPLFRDEAVAAARQRWLEPVAVSVPPTATAIAASAGVAVALLALAVVQVEIPDRVAAVGMLLPTERLIVVRAPRDGVIEELLVADGASVVAGQLLLRIADSDDSVRTAAARSIESLERELAEQSAAFAADRRALDAERARIDERAALDGDQQRLLRREQALRSQALRVDRRRLQRVRELAARGQLAADDRDIAEARHAALEAALLAADRQILEYAARIGAARHELTALDARNATLEANWRQAREVLGRQIENARSRTVVHIAAASSGEAAGVTVRNGSHVRAGQTLLSVYRPGERLQAWLYVDAADAARLQLRQRLELRLKAFPHTVYGTLSAEVERISALPVDGADAVVPLPAGSRVFEIRAKLEDLSLAAAGERFALRAGAAFQCELVRARRPLYRWLLRRLRSAG